MSHNELGSSKPVLRCLLADSLLICSSFTFSLYHFRNENPLDIPRAWAEKERKVVSWCSVLVSVKAGGCEKTKTKTTTNLSLVAVAQPQCPGIDMQVALGLIRDRADLPPAVRALVHAA